MVLSPERKKEKGGDSHSANNPSTRGDTGKAEKGQRETGRPNRWPNATPQDNETRDGTGTTTVARGGTTRQANEREKGTTPRHRRKARGQGGKQRYRKPHSTRARQRT